jgi:hypothetical protein
VIFGSLTPHNVGNCDAAARCGRLKPQEDVLETTKVQHRIICTFRGQPVLNLKNQAQQVQPDRLD